MTKKIGIAGLGAIGGATAKALIKGIPGLDLVAVSDLDPARCPPGLPILSFEDLADACDLVVECLPAAAVPDLAAAVLSKGKDLLVISSAALLIHGVILDQHRSTWAALGGRIIVPSGAVIGIDGVRALAQAGIKSAAIASTKKPAGYTGAPHIIKNDIDLAAIKTRTLIFEGNALEAARAFPANVNVAATLSLAGIGPERTMVQVWADPDAKGNTHEITVAGEFSSIHARVTNVPDPSNPKTSMLAAHSVINTLRDVTAPLVIL